MPEVEAWVEPYRSAAQKLVDQGAVGDIEFSGSTYQVEVEAGGEEYWPFLQFGRGGELQDAFCTCEEAEEKPSCLHQAAALLRIYHGHPEPLHERFQRSLWNLLCQIYCDRQGADTDVLHWNEESSSYEHHTPSGKQIFSLTPLTPKAAQFLKTLIDHRVRETEETSLKFSGLSHEELLLWREGRPSAALRYELSFWSDLAKWMMVQQDGEAPYHITFSHSARGLPNAIHISFEELKLEFYLSEANLPTLIPSLNSVESPLKVSQFAEEAVKRITYDPAAGKLEISVRELSFKEANTPPQGIEIGDWVYVPEQGFYAKESQGLLANRSLDGEPLSDLLDLYGEMVDRHLEGYRVHKRALLPRYDLSFDHDWTLHLHLYLFARGDLRRGHSALHGHWAFLDDDGFYPLEELPFDRAEVAIPEAEVSSFIHRNKIWLSGIEGFAPHLTAIDSSLTYSLDERGLAFETALEVAEERLDSHDFGEWIYVAGQGFYSKPRSRLASPVRAGLRVKPEEIPLFLEMHRDELEGIEGFFTQRNPISRATLSIELTSKQKIRIQPSYEFFPEVSDQEVQVYGAYAYLPGEGFAEIPLDLRLPERFRLPVELEGEEMRLFVAYEMENLSHFLTITDPRLQRPQELKLICLGAEAGEGAQRGLILTQAAYISPLGQVSCAQIWRALARQEPYLFSKAGLLDLKQSQFQWLYQLPPSRVTKGKDELRLTTLELMKLTAVGALEPSPELGKESQGQVQEILNSFSHLSPPEPPQLEGLRSQLRHYQEIGVHWLWFLYRYYLSGLLCDDMGLGKTHQAMALLAAILNALRDAPQEEQPYYLVVCPTSVMYHWEEKLQTFLPEMRIHTYHGVGRSLRDLPTFDLIITSYGVLRSDRKRFAEIPFELAIFDEIQVAKNSHSQTHATLKQLNARMRLGLTGTPIENSLSELQALFEIVLPGYLPPGRQFREHFLIPIEKEGDQEKRELLSRLINPFLLRRKKEEVLTELPEKIEEKAHCELTHEQRILYNGVLEQTREMLIQDLEDRSKPLPYMHIFSVLTSLKQICDHPAVYLKSVDHFHSHRSGKWELFCELLQQARESRQKVVIFSHYLLMLDIIEQHLQEQGIGYAAIRGSTRGRAEQLSRFQKDPQCEVFVGSLQAVGLGVDLTSASVVIHYDRWWNAARENQATDRVHRLGQTRGVQVIKLITLDTLEQRIDQLILSKARLMEEVVGSDEQGQLKNYSREELIELLSWVHPSSD